MLFKSKLQMSQAVETGSYESSQPIPIFHQPTEMDKNEMDKNVEALVVLPQT